jgi:isocitrate/isopropylmalate dehydrogenase
MDIKIMPTPTIFPLLLLLLFTFNSNVHADNTQDAIEKEEQTQDTTEEAKTEEQTTEAIEERPEVPIEETPNF